jgi:hypothetical protein
MDGEYMWAFFDEYSQSDATLDRLRRSRGFCDEHAERLKRLEVEGLKSNLGISTVYLDTFQGLADQLRSLRPGSDLSQPEECPACQYRDEEVERNARYLLEEITANSSSRQRFLDSNGLCFPHFQLTWERAEELVEQELLLELQGRVVAEIANDLAENIRKQGHEVAGGPSERESSSWQWAIYLTAGWSKEALRDPPPDPDRRYQLPEYARVRPRKAQEDDHD